MTANKWRVPSDLNISQFVRYAQIPEIPRIHSRRRSDLEYLDLQITTKILIDLLSARDSVYSREILLEILGTPMITFLVRTGTPVKTCWKFLSVVIILSVISAQVDMMMMTAFITSSWPVNPGVWDWRWWANKCQHESNFRLSVLLCFINTLLGNRYGPGVSSCQLISDNNLRALFLRRLQATCMYAAVVFARCLCPFLMWMRFWTCIHTCTCMNVSICVLDSSLDSIYKHIHARILST